MNAARAYYCPMHSDVRGVDGGACPHCGMNLVAEGTRFGIVQHMLGSPFHLAIMIAVMLAVMAAVMMMMR